MTRFTRINAIWKKELTDTLRDRRTMIAMIVVPMVLYPGMILISLMAFEFQATRIKHETYKVAVQSEEVRRWLRRTIDTDPSRQPLDTPVPAEDLAEAVREQREAQERSQSAAAYLPPEFEIEVVENLVEAVTSGGMHIAVALDSPPPGPTGDDSARIVVIRNQQDSRGAFAGAAMEGILQRTAVKLVEQRLKLEGFSIGFVNPLRLVQQNVATQAEIQGWFAGLLIPPILILLTITGTVYPAIDLTAGERERGTLETLMVAPVPTVDLITGKFIVVTLIGLMSAGLNLMAFAGTMYLGGLSNMLTTGWELTIPLSAIPWILLALLPLATMFGAILLAVSSFARSFKEAQNYVMPVIMAALLPALISVLPGTELSGANLIIPVANIVLLTRELLMGHFQWDWIIWVISSTSLYAFAAVVIAARLFGQEAVLFADNASIRTILQRRFFKPSSAPSISQALLVLAIAYPLNFFVQNALATAEGIARTPAFLYSIAVWLAVLFVAVPLAASLYTRVRPFDALRLRGPSPHMLAAGVLLGSSTWILGLKWAHFQQLIMPLPEQMRQLMEQELAFINDMNPAALLICLALVPAVCEELFFRGYVLSGVRGALGKVGAVVLVAVAFGLFHQSVHRLPITIALGLILGLLTLRSGSIWPAMIMHLMHNGLALALGVVPGFAERLAWPESDGAPNPPGQWVLAAAAVAAVGLIMCVRPGRRSDLGAGRVLAVRADAASSP